MVPEEDRPAETLVKWSRERLLEKYPAIAFLLPMIVFSIIGALEVTEPSETTLFGNVSHAQYPIVYSIKIFLTSLAIVFVWPTYRQFPLRVSPLAVGVGIVGVVLWVGIVNLGLERSLPMEWLIQTGDRVAFNPLQELNGHPWLAAMFLVIRFIGLAVVIAIAEEMFLRGFLIRYVEDPDRWNKLPIGQAGWTALVVGTVFPMFSHPGELFAAMVWFSLVSWLMLRTRNIWDCIVAHMITNLLLGIYVVSTGHWELW